MYVYICACVCLCVWGGGISDRDRRANFLRSKLSWLHILRYGYGWLRINFAKYLKIPIN
jgi:hypothetical protein